MSRRDRRRAQRRQPEPREHFGAQLRSRREPELTDEQIRAMVQAELASLDVRLQELGRVAQENLAALAAIERRLDAREAHHAAVVAAWARPALQAVQ